MQKIRVGTIGLSYAHKKNFFDLLPDLVEYKKDIDWLSPYRFLLRSIVLKKIVGSTLLRNSHFHPFQKSINVFHFFNTISFSNTPWITTFETSLPRWGVNRVGVERLVSDSCKAIVAMSACAKEIHLKRIRESFPEKVDLISDKLSVIHPSQRPLLGAWKEKNLNLQGKLIFTLVGNDFFRKGGKEVLEVFTELLASGADLELRIISNLKFGDYASQASHKDRDWALDRIAHLPGRIVHLQNLPHAEVIRLMKETHIGLLPTYADTYGYSVLEFQATACPVISTNVRALPEINNNKKGWVIEVPKDDFGEGKFKTQSDRNIMSAMIKAGLKSTIQEIMTNPSAIREKGDLALKELAFLNCPTKNGLAYLKLYQRAIGID